MVCCSLMVSPYQHCAVASERMYGTRELQKEQSQPCVCLSTPL